MARKQRDNRDRSRHPNVSKPKAVQPARDPGVDAVAELNTKLAVANPKYAKRGRFAHADGKVTGVDLREQAIDDIDALTGHPITALDLAATDVASLEPLRGMPLKELYLEDSNVSDISPLAGMPLEKLFLSDTLVNDLSVLKDCATLRELNIVGTQVSDLSPLAGLKLESLWINGCPVTTLDALCDMPLASLSIEATKIDDLSPLQGKLSLRRLSIVGSEVRDLTPLAGSQLRRLVLDPDEIEKGLDDMRKLPALMEAGTDVTHLHSATQFWRFVDEGTVHNHSHDHHH